MSGARSEMSALDEAILGALLARGWRPVGGVEPLRARVAEPLVDAAVGSRGALRRWVAEGRLDPWWASEALAAHFGLKAVTRSESVSATQTPILAALPRSTRESLIALEAIPLRWEAGSLELAIDNPLDDAVLARIGVLLGGNLVPVVAPVDWIRAAWRRVAECAANRVSPEAASFDRGLPDRESDGGPSGISGAVYEDAPVRPTAAPIGMHPSVNPPAAVSIETVVDTLFEEAIGSRASDIHLEPSETRIRVRHRIDGVLREAGEVAADRAAAVVARTKLLAGMSIVERRRPQDGRFRWRSREGLRDFRVSSVPTIRGESVVIRVLDAASHRDEERDRLSGIFPGETRERWERLIQSHDGLVLITGPTGSGKSATLHASLSRLAESGRKVITIEDPVERELPRVVQVGVRADLGLGFPQALRAVLRQSPEAIAVGEVRDRETARSCLNAALTGHLVFSTLHTADAVGAIVRLRDLGVSSSLLASALRGVVAQRLVRRVCRSCVRSSPVGRENGSCADCRGTGYSGRLAVVELMVVDDTLRALIRRDSGADALRAAAVAAGMRTLAQEAQARMRIGQTTPDELYRVLGSAHSSHP